MNSSETLGDRRRLISAALSGQLEEVILQSSKCENDVSPVLIFSETLIRSCVGGHLDVVKWLVGHTAADVNYTDTKELWYTPLTAACVYNHLATVKYLVETCHADVNLPDNRRYTSLIRACRYVNIPVSIYLLCKVSDLDVNSTDREGNTALHYAVWYCKDHNTQLHKACYRRDVTEVWRLVYVRGHKINVQDNGGNTPLHYACSYSHSDIIEMQMLAGSHNNEYVHNNSFSDIVETLMLAGADETITNDEGKTPAQVAESRRHRELLKLLDRDSLWQVMRRRQNKLNLSLVVLMMLTVRLMRQKQIAGRWCYAFNVVHVMLAIRSVFKFNRNKLHKLMRKTNCII